MLGMSLQPDWKHMLTKFCGWVNDPAERDRIAALQPYPVFGDAASSIKGSGRGKDVLIWQTEERITGKAVRDPNSQETGDCVAMALAQAAEDLQYVQHTSKFEKIATEVIYAGGRVEIGGGRLWGAGMIVGWALQWGLRYGLLPRRKYGSHNLTVYSGKRADEWGAPRAGCPDELEPEARKYPIITASLLQGPNFYEQAIDAIANNCLIVTGSNQLFSQRRDKNGFITPQGNGGHSTYYRAFTDNPSRPGIWYQNSWGRLYHIGPQVIEVPGRNQQVTVPYGGGFIDAEVFNRIHRGNEVWVVTRMTNFAPDPADEADYKIRFY
jgi:hypothetical protein